MSVKVTVNQQKILNAIKENPFVTQEELVQIVDIAKKNIVTNMNKLQENGIIKRIGADKNGRWKLKTLNSAISKFVPSRILYELL